MATWILLIFLILFINVGKHALNIPVGFEKEQEIGHVFSFLTSILISSPTELRIQHIQSGIDMYIPEKVWLPGGFNMFQPIWKILVKLDHYPGRGENNKYLKPPPR